MSNLREKRKKRKKRKIISLISSIIKVFLQELGMAFLPIFTIEFICAMMSRSRPVLTIYNNLFIGFVTLNMGNILYLHNECKNVDENIKNILFSVSCIALIFSLIAFVITLLEEWGMCESQINKCYWMFSVLFVFAIVLTESLKIADDYGRKSFE